MVNHKPTTDLLMRADRVQQLWKRFAAYSKAILSLRILIGKPSQKNRQYQTVDTPKRRIWQW
jgi:hypothetical protein